MNIKRLRSQIPAGTPLIEVAEKDIQDDAFPKSDSTVVYHYDGNTVLVKAIKNYQACIIAEAWEIINSRLKVAGVRPKMYILDNECSSDLKVAFRKESIKFQLVPPASHYVNTVERAIQTYKNHLKYGLSRVDPKFPIREWD